VKHHTRKILRHKETTIFTFLQFSLEEKNRLIVKTYLITIIEASCQEVMWLDMEPIHSKAQATLTFMICLVGAHFHTKRLLHLQKHTIIKQVIYDLEHFLYL